MDSRSVMYYHDTCEFIPALRTAIFPYLPYSQQPAHEDIYPLAALFDHIHDTAFKLPQLRLQFVDF